MDSKIQSLDRKYLLVMDSGKHLKRIIDLQMQIENSFSVMFT